MLQALESRFAPSYYDDPQGMLFKLWQTGTVTEYLTEFERLANHTFGLTPSCLLNCFMSGLIPKLRRQVQALRPMSVPQATKLARLQEDKMLDRRSNHRSYSSPSPAPPKPHPPSANPTPRLPIKRLMAEELAVRRDQGLCYHCDDKWSPGHRCKMRLHLFIANEDFDFSSDPLVSPLHATPEPALVPQISLNVMEGTPAPQTFHLLGSLRNHQVVILVDGGSTHNFIQMRMAKFFALSFVSTLVVCVMVGNGNTLDCDTQSLQVSISIQNHCFTLDLFHLPICGANIVLGVQWLKLLGPVTTDYQSLTMTFNHLGRDITLCTDAPPCPSSASTHQLKRLLQTQSISALFHITYKAPPISMLLILCFVPELTSTPLCSVVCVRPKMP